MLRLESRPKNIEGQGEIPIRELVRNALRMRPDRIIVGEVRGSEALDMLQAMNTGHDGSLSTCHANTPRDAIARIESMVLMAGVDFPMRAIRQQVSRALDLVVQIERFSDGARKVTSITEVQRMEGDTVTLQEIFEYRIDKTHLQTGGSARLHGPASDLRQVRAQRRRAAALHGRAQLWRWRRRAAPGRSPAECAGGRRGRRPRGNRALARCARGTPDRAMSLSLALASVAAPTQSASIIPFVAISLVCGLLVGVVVLVLVSRGDDGLAPRRRVRLAERAAIRRDQVADRARARRQAGAAIAARRSSSSCASRWRSPSSRSRPEQLFLVTVAAHRSSSAGCWTRARTA